MAHAAAFAGQGMQLRVAAFCLCPSLMTGCTNRWSSGSLNGSSLRSMHALCREVGGPFAEARCVAVACPSCMTLELAQSCGEYVVSGCVECSLCIVQAGPHPCADAAPFRASLAALLDGCTGHVWDHHTKLYLTNCAKLGMWSHLNG